MGKFLLGFVVGVGVGAGLTLLLTPEPGHVNRERLRASTDRYASGDETPLGSVRQKIEAQRARIEEAIQAGRRASAERQAELWSQLHLTPPELSEPAPPELPVTRAASLPGDGS